MLRANIYQIFIADISYNNMLEYFTNFNHSVVNITDRELLFEKEKVITKFDLEFNEEDSFTKSYLSILNDGSPFRVIRPKGISKEISLGQSNSIEGFTIGSINKDGYAVTFFLTNKNDIRNFKIILKGIDDHLQKLSNSAMMALNNNLDTDFYNISRRLIKVINTNGKNIHILEFGTQIAEILKANIQLYDEKEQKIIVNL